MKLIATPLLILLSGSFSFAQINLKEAAYTKTINELQIPGLQKTYSSRSLHRGIFGFGWCSEIEIRLQFLSGRKVLKHHCGRTFLAKARREKDRWILEQNGQVEIFNSQGRLLEKPLHGLRFAYSDQGQLSRILVSNRAYSVKWDSNGTRITVIQHEDRRVSYDYSSAGNLMNINAPDGTRIFFYDSMNNLTDFKTRQGSEKITYSQDSDEVRSFESSESPCQYRFRYRRISSTTLESKVEKACPGAETKSVSFLFQGKPAPEGRLLLSEIKTQGVRSEFQTIP